MPGVPSDYTLVSFDGTRIRIHWFPQQGASSAHRVPTVLMGPGWGGAGDTDTTTPSTPGSLTIRGLRDAGYNVLTWDPRGFGQSGGTVEIDSPNAEGRDVQQIIDWVAKQPQALVAAPGDPRVGMVGASYGGGIQLSTAAIDCRVDAIVPSWAWNSLETSLYKADTYKSGWSSLLFAAALGHSLDPHVADAYQSSNATGQIDSADQSWFEQRGPGGLVGRIRAPTLLVQGTVDTLFTLQEAATNYRILHAHGVPSAMLWFCGGHGVCLTNPGNQNVVNTETLAWLSRYLDGNTRAPTVPTFDFVDQSGRNYTAARYPVPLGSPITAEGSGTLQLTAAGGSGPAHPAPSNPSPLAAAVAPITPAKAANAVDVPVSTGSRSAVVVGAPKLQLTYSGTVAPGTRPTRVFAQLVDGRTGLVLGNQVTPIDVTLDGRDHTSSVPLEIVAYSVKPGSRLTLQLVATTVAYAQPRLGGSVHFERIHLSLPVAAGISPR